MSTNATRNRRNPNRRPLPSTDDLEDPDYRGAYDDDDTCPDGRSRIHDEEIGGHVCVVIPATA